MNAMPREPVNREEVFAYLDVLRSTDITNVFGAADYVADGFGISPGQASKLLADWIKSKETGQLDGCRGVYGVAVPGMVQPEDGSCEVPLMNTSLRMPPIARPGNSDGGLAPPSALSQERSGAPRTPESHR